MCSAESKKDPKDSLPKQSQVPKDTDSANIHIAKGELVEGPLKGKEEHAFKKLLLVDGYSPELDMVESRLKELMGKTWEIITADNLRDAIKILKEQKEVGLVVTGMTYPKTKESIKELQLIEKTEFMFEKGMEYLERYLGSIQKSGLALVKYTKIKCPQVKVAAFSAWKHKLDQAKKDGADFTIPKDDIMISPAFDEFIKKETSDPVKNEQIEEAIGIQLNPIFNNSLIVDDDEAMLTGMEYILGEAVGIERNISFATTLEGAKSVLEKQRDISLVITDISYPEKEGKAESPESGLKFIKYLKEKNPKIIVIAYSSDSKYLEKAKEAGADYIILKKTLDNLKSDVDNVIKKLAA